MPSELVENLKQARIMWHSPEYDGATEVGFEIIITAKPEGDSNSQELHKASVKQHTQA